MSRNLRVFKLVNGELIIANVVEETETEVVLDKPFQVGIFPNEARTGEVIGVIDFNGNFNASDKLAVKTDKVLYSFDPHKQLEETYLNNTDPNRIIPVPAGAVPDLQVSDLAT